MSEAFQPHSDSRGAISRHSFLPLVTFTSPEGHEFVAREAFDELAAKASGLQEQLEALRETIRHADHFIRQPIDLNYVAIPKDDWEIILARVSNPASEPDA